jgi:sulfonate transport system permease protein
VTILESTGTEPVDTGRPPALRRAGRVTDAVPPAAGSGAPAIHRRAERGEARWLRIVGPAIVPVALLVVWHVSTTSGLVPPYRLPAPASVLAAGVDLFQRGDLTDYVLISVQRVLIGFGAGAGLGLAIGSLVGLSRRADLLLSTTIGALRAVPSLAWVPLLVIWLQFGEESKVTLVAIGAFFPVYTTVTSALRHVDPHLVEAGRAYGLHGPALLGRVQLPAATPGVVAGLRLGLAQAWLFLVAAELLGASMGLGFLLTDSQSNGRVDRILLAIVALAVLGKATDALIGLGERRLLRRW